MLLLGNLQKGTHTHTHTHTQSREDETEFTVVVARRF